MKADPYPTLSPRGRTKILTGLMAAKYVGFMGSLTVKTTLENAKKMSEIVVHSKMRLVEPW